MTWIQTHSGLAFDLLDPKPEQVSLDDISHALAHTNRFSGHVGRWSVAQHSIVVAEIAVGLLDHQLREQYRDEVYLDGLLHDAHEAYVGDMVLPLKRALPDEMKTWWRELEANVQDTIETALGCQWPDDRMLWREYIKQADVMACDAERKALGMWPEARPWGLPYECRQEDVDMVCDVKRGWGPGADLAHLVRITMRRLGWG